MAGLIIFEKSRIAIAKDKIVFFKAEDKILRIRLVNGEELSFPFNTEEECEEIYNDLLEVFNKQ